MAKIAVVEGNIEDEHDELVIECVRMYSPNAEIRLWDIERQTPVKTVNEIIEWGADIVNMSFHGWNVDMVARYRHLQEYKDTYETYDKWFNHTIICCASGNTGDETLNMPAATEEWKDCCLSIGASERGDITGFTTDNDKLDFIYPDSITVNGVTHRGTSFASPKVAGLCALIHDIYPCTPQEMHRILKVMSTTTPKGYNLIEKRIPMEHVIVFTLNSASYTVDNKERLIKGYEDELVPMPAINGRTFLPVRVQNDIINEFAPIVSSKVEWLQDTQQVKWSLISVK